MQSVSTRIWTRVDVSISHDDNDYTTGTSKKMIVIPLVPETKMVDVSKLICLGNLLVRKVTGFVLITMSATLILSRAFGLPIYTLAFQELILFHIFTYRDSTLSFHIVTQLNSRNMGAYTFCNLFLSCSAFSVKLLPASNTASEILSKRQATNMGEDTSLLEYIAVFFYINTLHEILSPHTFYSLQDTFNI